MSSKLPEELAIASLTSSIFNLADSGNLFLDSLAKLRSKTKLAKIMPRTFSALEPARREATWLVGFINECFCSAEDGLAEDASRLSSERRQSVSFIINVFVFQLTYLSNHLFVGSDSRIRTQKAVISLLGGRKGIQRRVNDLYLHSKELTQLLAYLNGVRPSLRLLKEGLQPLSMVPRIASNYFKGRDETLRFLASELFHTKRAAVVGNRGTGKSELCIQYANKIREAYPKTWIFWINGQECTKSLAEIARCLRISQEDGNIDSKIASWLHNRHHGPWLLILDDFDLDSSILRLAGPAGKDPLAVYIQTLKCQPRLTGRGNILIGSRDFKALPKGFSKDHGADYHQPIELSSLKKDVAIRLLQSWIGRERTTAPQDVERLATSVGYLPMDLRDFASYITKMRLTVAQCLEHLTSIREMQSQLASEDIQRQGDTVYRPQEPSNLLVLPETAPMEPVTSERPPDSGSLPRIEELNKAISPSTITLQPDVMTAASFVARLILAEPGLIGVLKMIEVKIDNMNKLEAALKSYADKLRSAAKKNSLQAVYAEFIYKHPKRIAFTLMELSLQDNADGAAKKGTGRSTVSTVDTPLSLNRWMLPIGKGISRSNSLGAPQHISASLRSTNASQIYELEHIGDFLKTESILSSLIIDLCVLFSVSPPTSQVGEFVKMITDIFSTETCNIVVVDYVISWELETVLSRVFKERQSIKKVLVISGEADDAQAATCEEYVAQNWKHALPLLDILDSCRWGADNTGEPVGDKGIYLSKVEGDYEQQPSLKVVVKDIPEIQAHIAATLTWLAASIRYSEIQKLSKSHSSIVLTLCNGVLTFQVRALPLEPVKYETSCWHQLFVCMVVATGYPVSERHQGKGLEIDYKLMTALARASLVTEWGHGLVNRGLQFTLVPVELLGHKKDDPASRQAVQWHLLLNSDLDKPENEIFRRTHQPIFAGRGRWKTKDPCEFEQLAAKRAFLGWWNKIQINIGTERPGTAVIKSGARAAGRPKAIKAVGAGLTAGGKGVTGGLNVLIGVGDRNNRAQLALSDSIEKNLDEFKTRNLVLYDTDTQRAWMLPYIAVVLYLVHLRERGLEDPGPGLQPPYASIHPAGITEPRYACEAAYLAVKPIIAILKDRDERAKAVQHEPVLLAEKSAKEKLAQAERLRDNLEQVFLWLFQAQEKAKQSRDQDMDITHRKVHGPELEDLAHGQFHFKQQRLRYTSGGWSVLRRDTGVLFCSGIGDAIIPVLSSSESSDSEYLCGKWREVPKGKDYLVAPVYCLSKSEEVHPLSPPPGAGNTPNPKRPDYFTIMDSRQRKEWKLGHAHFQPCQSIEESHKKYCQRTVRMRNRWHGRGSEKSMKDFAEHMDGAVVFGRAERRIKVRSYLSAAWKNVKGRDEEARPKTVPTTASTSERASCDLVGTGNESDQAEVSAGIDFPLGQVHDVQAPHLRDEHVVPSRQSGISSVARIKPPPPIIPGSPQQPGRAELNVPSTDDSPTSHRLSSASGTHTRGASSMTSNPGEPPESVRKETSECSETTLQHVGVWATGGA